MWYRPEVGSDFSFDGHNLGPNDGHQEKSNPNSDANPDGTTDGQTDSTWYPPTGGTIV